ncbi:protein ECERIFERUM 26-like [Corylus avellana]|uniref:protein ECERIFERUM 26-like n=1 Tax=Corylus avellana TaxID=13451 RepID=UPI001E2059F4|nr:protein ECERIFERUM 26-like [Corylus avellana]XP_059447862.1 protein ECERIFERUM 26-like [Corylus avellana]
MVSSKEESPVYGVRLSSVGPSRWTGSGVVHELSGMDLAMKLHYLKLVYFFSSHAAEGVTVVRLKETIFEWLNHNYYTSGRVWRSEESGRPYIKCNDCGSRFIEAQCDKTVDQWLETKEWSLDNLLVSQQVIGPQLSFSPPLLIQVTQFKCGGMSLGLSWAHILGDAFCLSDFINGWGRILAGIRANSPSNFHKPDPQIERPKNPPPLSVKQVDPVGDHWITANNCKMDTFSFHVTASQLAILQSSPNQTDEIPIFESLCGVIWQCFAKVREGRVEPKTVTICRKDPTRPTNGIVTNTQIISSIKADFSIMETSPKKLAKWILNQAVDERRQIEELVESDGGVSDFIVYGANLTFVDLQEAEFYGLELNGHKPDWVSFSVQGVGDEGAVLVFPGRKDCGEARVVTIILPENEAWKLKSELVKNGLLSIV